MEAASETLYRVEGGIILGPLPVTPCFPYLLSSKLRTRTVRML